MVEASDFPVSNVFCLAFQLTAENLVMMNKVAYFQSSPSLSFLSNQDSAGETSLHLYRAHFPKNYLCASCVLLSKEMWSHSRSWDMRDSKEKKPETTSACDHYKSLMNECSETLNPYITSSVVQTLILLLHRWLYSQFAESILKLSAEVI